MKLVYCVECSQKLTQSDQVEYNCPSGHAYFNNPRSAVAIAFINPSDKILFARRAREPQKGKLDLPGGFVDPGETLEEAVIREAKEELGVDIETLQYLISTNNTYGENTYTCDAFFIATKWQGDFKPADDVASIEWHPLDIMVTDEFSWENWRPIYPKLKELLSKV